MDHAPGATHEAVPLDPENDIDAKSAVRWVVGGAIALFVSLWLMVPIFIQVQDREIQKKVNLAPNQRFDEIYAVEKQFLDGDNPTKKSIQSVVDSLRR